MSDPGRLAGQRGCRQMPRGGVPEHLAGGVAVGEEEQVSFRAVIASRMGADQFESCRSSASVSEAAAATCLSPTGWHRCLFPLVRRHRTRNGAGKPVTGLRRSSSSAAWQAGPAGPGLQVTIAPPATACRRLPLSSKVRATRLARRFTPPRESAVAVAQAPPAADGESWHAARAVNHSSKRTLGKTCRSAARRPDSG
jgi:hypothetical protein